MAYARRSDPETSHEAAETTEAAGNAELQRHAIVTYLRRVGARGATADELDQELFDGHHTAGRRLSELRVKGDAVRLEETRMTTRNCRARVWMYRDSPPPTLL